jgi:hypothetical protein
VCALSAFLDKPRVGVGQRVLQLWLQLQKISSGTTPRDGYRLFRVHQGATGGLLDYSRWFVAVWVSGQKPERLHCSFSGSARALLYHSVRPPPHSTILTPSGAMRRLAIGKASFFPRCWKKELSVQFLGQRRGYRLADWSQSLRAVTAIW